jgi:1-acyl-sn-glycerol-3-phosphate acyltransferase
MPDPDPREREGGVALEPAAREPGRSIAQTPDALRAQLPGLEPDRMVTDWGRSERTEALVDHYLYGFLFHYWFRVEVEGIENVPADGGALMLANHAGALPADATMIAKAIREKHAFARPLHLASEHDYGQVPGLGMLVTKVGAVPAHPANVHRLLFDERQLVLAFPEGWAATRKPFKDRYRMRPFDRPGPLEVAINLDVPIIPVAVLGAEEATPVVRSINARRWLRRLPTLPLAAPVPLPAKFRIRFLEPVYPGRLVPVGGGDADARDRLANDVRALIQENLLEMVAARRSVWLG